MIDSNLCHRAVAQWGVASQLDLVIEECTELILAIQRFKRGRASLKHIVEESVDVSFMIEQLKAMFPVQYEEDWDFYVETKSHRLEDLLNEAI